MRVHKDQTLAERGNVFRKFRIKNLRTRTPANPGGNRGFRSCNPPVRGNTDKVKKTHVPLLLGLLFSVSAHAADVFYQKSLSLYVIHDVEQGKSEGLPLDSSVEKYAADAGAVLYVKGQTLHLIRNTREPKLEILETGVSDFQMRNGLVAFIKNGHLHVRRVEEPASVESRRVADSQGLTSMDVNVGTIVYLKNSTALYRVTSIDKGTSERITYPVSNVLISAP